MKISTEIYSASRHFGEERAIEYLAKAGFDAWDFSLFTMCEFDWDKQAFIPENDHPLSKSNYLEFVRKLRRAGTDFGIECNQTHAPFPSRCGEIRSYMKRAIECTAEAGAKICVVHPDHAIHEKNIELYRELLPFAKEYGVKLAAENMYSEDENIIADCSTPELFNRLLDTVNDDFLVACLDIGHAEMSCTHTSAVDMIKGLGKRLKALHIHDNDKTDDTHQIPFSMNIDFGKIIKALKEIGYDGYLTLEANNFLRDLSTEEAYEGIKRLAESAKRLAEMFENGDL